MNAITRSLPSRSSLFLRYLYLTKMTPAKMTKMISQIQVPAFGFLGPFLPPVAVSAAPATAAAATSVSPVSFSPLSSLVSGSSATVSSTAAEASVAATVASTVVSTVPAAPESPPGLLLSLSLTVVVAVVPPPPD